jgi:hypothetical protein
MKVLSHEEMTLKDQYYFGSLLKEVDIFAFPRTGSHFFAYCFSGLFDSVSLLPQDFRTLPEAISRQNELNVEVLYALSLREPGVPFQPVWLNSLVGGPHGMPVPCEHPVLVLIRDPIATAFSAWRSRHRLGYTLETARDVNVHLDKYESFYDAAMRLREQGPESVLMVQYELLTASFHMLERVVDFVGLRPKLAPRFVHWLTRFENFVGEGKRTFYCEGDNQAWRRDEQWCALLRQAGMRDFARFGY